ncbi:MAG: EVE domain-containing protein [Alphaproteobacteria bacterium]|nr:EVE domain-containing protein [Alphaproteobacteria bacterium]NCQ67175.1 EVE domain-containing protein [Alphaproteobacteria bacterium]NCT07020.1 EVE domain-containing protein [Alphaproteobacteria bacterium]
MNYWLIKSEPNTWSWEDQKRVETEPWNGVRNYQAANNMKAMKTGDLAFFYHSVKERKIVGIVEVVKEYYPDPSDETGRFGMVDFKVVEDVKHQVTLQEIKDDPRLSHLPLVKQSRLSVSPVDKEAWSIIYANAQQKN